MYERRRGSGLSRDFLPKLRSKSSRVGGEIFLVKDLENRFFLLNSNYYVNFIAFLPSVDFPTKYFTFFLGFLIEFVLFVYENEFF